MDQQTQIILGIGVVALILFALWTFKDAGKRRHNPLGKRGDNTEKGCAGNCGCNCAPPPKDGCIPAVECAPPYSPPIAIRGLSCDPNDPQYVHAADIQMVVDAMNDERERDRAADSVERFRSALDRMGAKRNSSRK